ncbi:hypothetical protein CLF_105979 [Clonorchis sinensis]|uniref:Uncharacterized protein n=1 Tax=Clonorchis sinensis TaxID=79923 RepID=G7YEG6_CLOSI|nr:hypothetical protein CLF_105979 [Clonorchis sinensis]
MKMLEKRTDQSKQEMEMVEVIEDLKQLNERLAGMDTDHLVLRKLWQEEEAQRKAEEEADEQLIKYVRPCVHNFYNLYRELLAERSAPVTTGSDLPSSTNHTPNVPDLVSPRPSNSATLPSMPKGPARSNTYMKRQLQGVVLVKRPVSEVENKSSNLSESRSTVSSSEADGPTSSKVPKVSSASSEPLSTVSNPLPGITYSDDSDSN